METTPAETALANMERLLRRVQADGALLRKRGRLDEISKELPPLEAAKLSSSLAYTLLGMYKAYMRLNGLGEEGHKIFGELERNRHFIQQIKAAEESLPGNEPLKKLKLDTAAVARMTRGEGEGEKEKGTRQVNKGSILPQREHLNWKEKLQRLQE